MQKNPKKPLHIDPSSSLKQLTVEELKKASGGDPLVPKLPGGGGDCEKP